MISANAALLSDDNIDLSQLGIDTVSLDQADTYLEGSNPSVLGAHCRPGNYQRLITLLLKEKRKNINKRFIIFFEDLSSKQLIEIHNLIHPSKSLPYSRDWNFQQTFQECFAFYYELEQGKELLAMVNETNDELKRLTLALEQKVVERQSELVASLSKNTNAEKRLQVLKTTLMQIYQATSIREIEHGVAFALKKQFGISGVQIRRPSQSNFGQMKTPGKHYRTALKSGAQEFGHIYFFREQNESFNSQEKRFLNQVAEAASLSMARTIRYMNSQELKTQWEATFDAISDPICLTDEDYVIKRVNAGFLKQTGTDSYLDHLGEKCYKALFQRETPCEGCQRGQIFQLRNPAQNQKSEVFDVYSNNLGESQSALYFQMYRDVTGDLNLQRQVIESAKMAELGTISSSIAHELNNPIGGMLNFIQLMKMDLQGNEEFYADIIEIEKGIIKCKNIVKNLLGFARKSFNTEIDEVNLAEVLEQAIKITELKTQSIGIKIQFDRNQSDVFIEGRFNLLTHAFRNILQNSQESLIAKRKQDKHFKGLIHISLNEGPEAINIEITDNGEGVSDEVLSRIFDPLFTTKDPETNSGLGLTLALQIVKEHNGTIKVSTDKDKKLLVNVRFFKSEVQSGPSGF
jgi:two-component system NtrC family sensor kinase